MLTLYLLLSATIAACIALRAVQPTSHKIAGIAILVIFGPLIYLTTSGVKKWKQSSS